MDFIAKCIQKERPLMSDCDAEKIASAIREEIKKKDLFLLCDSCYCRRYHDKGCKCSNDE